MRRLLAVALLGVVFATNVASAAAPGCRAMRARAPAGCCCPLVAPGIARLTCCAPGEDTRAAAADREQSERVQEGPPLAAPVFFHPGDKSYVALAAPSPELLASAAGPPPPPLRV